MPYWTRTTVHERLVQLVEDCRAIGEQAINFDGAIGGSVGLPPGQVGEWYAFGEYVGAERARFPTLADRLSVLAARLPRADESDVAELRIVASEAYELLHRALPRMDAWVGAPPAAGPAALELRRLLVGGEDEAHRVLAGSGDLRRSLRRARQVGLGS